MPTLVNGSAGRRFELPALDLNFGNITDGTNIPPPPRSPKVPTPPQTPPPTKKAGPAVAVVSGNETDKSTPPRNGNIAGIKRPADEAPLSPAGSARQNSLRKLFSRNMLNTSYVEGNLASMDNGSLAAGSRPPSRGGASSIVGGRKLRRSSWFGLFKGGESKRSSILFDETPSPQKPTRPPPPVIPELKDLEKEEGSLGNDLFKNIK
ncbi:uncharacterized protein MAM_03320 [Metarhizium album ARSEF 1941]|uniref:Uncharacterized protein n=1 Tax=Metarhizium album (strain ARSEF 1941) TaxID=1081103 RepID=A0A0B2WXU9_METAS|nr:uncharacterized protein MAM_03320 [Metarhizium album ARSEF 1941]KHN98858.1 hypothetical protein MAM_03320 [Metarhizium album ARSEF 1941]